MLLLHFREGEVATASALSRSGASTEPRYSACHRLWLGAGTGYSGRNNRHHIWSMSSGAAKRVSSHPTKNPVAPEATGFRPMQLGCDLSVLGHQDRPWAAEATRLAAPCSYFRVSASNTEAWASTIPRGVLSRSPQSRAPSDRLPILARRATKNLSAEPRPCDWVGHEGQHLSQAMFAENSEHSAEISLVAAFWVELAMTDGRWP